jgi:putative oxidoreductase
MKRLIFQTGNSWEPLVIRAFLAFIIFAHGGQKLFGWWGGYGFEGTMSFFTETVGIPWLLGFGVILLETFGAIALLTGAATRLIATSYIFLAIGIVLSWHIQNGFYMNWEGTKAGEGYEFFILWIGMAISLVISGGGKFSLDSLIQFRSKSIATRRVRARFSEPAL